MRRSIRAARGCRACRRPGARGRATLGPGRPQSSCGTRRRRLSGRFASSQCRPRRTAVIPGTSVGWATRSDRRWVGVRAGAAAGARVRTWPRAPPRTSPRPRCAQLEGLMSSAKRSLVPFRRLRGRATAGAGSRLIRIDPSGGFERLWFGILSSTRARLQTLPWPRRPGHTAGRNYIRLFFPSDARAAKRPTGGPLCRS